MPIRWSAPEVLRDQRRHARSDVWSFGVLLWEIFALGETPYSNIDSEEEVAQLVLNGGGRLPRPSALANEALYDLARACWNDAAEKRPDFEMVLEKLRRAGEPCLLVGSGKETGEYVSLVCYLVSTCWA